MYKVGLVGAGYISKMHLEGWTKQHNAEIAAMCDLNMEKLQERAQEYRIAENKLYANVDEMLANADIDIVDIITGPETHLALVKKAAAAGKHILCQKPFAPELSQAEEIVRIAKEHGVRLMVTENWRWLEPIQNLQRVIASGILGKISYVKYHSSHFFTPGISPEKEIPQPYFRDMPRLVMYEMGVHWFDVWRMLFGDPIRLYAEMRQVSPYIVGEDVGTVMLGHEGFHGIMEMSWASRRGLFDSKPEMFYIESDQCALKMDGDGRLTVLDDDGERVLNGPLTWDMADSFRLLQKHYLHCLDTGMEFQTGGEHNVKTLKLVFDAYESAKSGKAFQY